MGRRRSYLYRQEEPPPPPPKPVESILESTRNGGGITVLDITPCLKNYPAKYMECADTLLILESGKAFLSHRAILASHSAVLCDMLAHLAATSAPGEKLKLPFKDYAEKECEMLLVFLHGKAPCFPSQDAAVVVANFAHKYDDSESLAHAEAHLIICIKDRYEEEVGTCAAHAHALLCKPQPGH